MAEIRSASTQPAVAVSAMASVIGVRREDRGEGIPESVEIRLRLENDGPEPATFDPHSLELAAPPSCCRFPSPVVRTPSPIKLRTPRRT